MLLIYESSNVFYEVCGLCIFKNQTKIYMDTHQKFKSKEIEESVYWSKILGQSDTREPYTIVTFNVTGVLQRGYANNISRYHSATGWRLTLTYQTARPTGQSSGET